MLHRTILRFSVVLASALVLSATIALHAQDPSSQHARKYKPTPPAARIEVTVVKDFNSKPIEDAHVIFHPIEGDKDKGVLELKTNEDGKVVIDLLPIGDTVRMQIIANGYQTFGQDYKVDKSDISMEIRMKRPGSQYSIYKDSSTAPKSSGNSGSDKSSSPSQNSNSSGDKSSGSSSNKSGNSTDGGQTQPN